MSIENLLAVLGWCMVVNISVVLLLGLAMVFAPDLIYRTQRLVVHISREEFELTLYRMMGHYKLGILLFNFSPYVALRIVY